MKRGAGIYWAGAVIFLVLYGAIAYGLHSTKDFGDDGPLSLMQPDLAQPFEGALGFEETIRRCFGRPANEDTPEIVYRVVGGVVGGKPYYGCYKHNNSILLEARVLDAVTGAQVYDRAILKPGGAWPWVAPVKTSGDLVLGGLGVLAVATGFWAYYRRPRPGDSPRQRWWQRTRPLVIISAVPILGWLVLAQASTISRERKIRVAMIVLLMYALVVYGVVIVAVTTYPDSWGLWVIGLLGLGFVYSGSAARGLVAPAEFGAPETAEPLVSDSVEAVPAPDPEGRQEVARTFANEEPDVSPQSAGQSDDLMFKVQRPGTLPTFSDVGGMEDLKRELKETFGLMLAFSGEAEAYRITWNGVLLHGPPGVGKTFLARATAGEFGLNLVHVSAGDLVSAYRGESARNVEEAFKFAARNIPSILFFDEFDSIAQAREDWPDQEARRTVNQLLTSLEEYRVVREQIVMAATNSLDELDPAVVRPGRFDRHIRVDLPDRAAREQIFAVHLDERPVAEGLDLGVLADRAAGLTPAAIAQTVEMAALSCFRQAATDGAIVELTMDHLIAALDERGGRDRPTVEAWSWDRLVLPEDVKAELQQLQAIIEDPQTALAMGIDPPTGVLLTGPPGTGKTSIAKVLAAEGRCSFYPISAADVTSKWLGESERNIARLFRRARENRPSIIFIDEVDAIASRRGEWDSYDRQINELLEEMDGVAGQQGVFVLAATNRPDKLDPALLRGGRLSRTIEIPLPDRAGRRAILALLTNKMPLGDVDLDEIAAMTEECSGADLKAVCQQAALHAMMRARKGRTGRVTKGKKVPSLLHSDFVEAVKALRPSRSRR